MESNPQFGSMPTVTQPPASQPPYAAPQNTVPPSLPPQPSSSGAKGARTTVVVLVTLIIIAVAAATLPGAVVRARTIAYPKPSVSITMPGDSGTVRVGDAITLAAQVQAGNNLNFIWDFGDGTSGQGARVTHTYTDYSSNGYNVSLDAVDPIGQHAQAQTTINALPAIPVAAFIATPDPNDPFDVVFDASASSGTQLTCVWDFGDGSSDDSGECQTYNEYSQLGHYNVTLTVTDIANQTASKEQSVAVTIPKPTASFTATADDFFTSAVDVDASASTGYELTYEWDWGDGNTEDDYSSSSYHYYDNPGTYTITLTVIDGGGQKASTRQTVTVGS